MKKKKPQTEMFSNEPHLMVYVSYSHDRNLFYFLKCACICKIRLVRKLPSVILSDFKYPRPKHMAFVHVFLDEAEHNLVGKLTRL